MKILALIFLLCAHSAFSTTVIVYTDSDQVLIGSDGMIKLRDGTLSPGFSKIRLFKNTVVGVAGLLWYEPSFNAFLVASNAVATNQSFTSILSNVEGVCSTALSNIFNGPGRAELMQSDLGVKPLQYIFAQWRPDGDRDLCILQFRMRTNSAGTLQFTVSEEPDHCGKGRIQSGCIGNISTNTLCNLTNSIFWDGNPQERVARLIYYETKNIPDRVGLPLYFIQLNQSGEHREAVIKTDAEVQTLFQRFEKQSTRAQTPAGSTNQWR